MDSSNDLIQVWRAWILGYKKYGVTFTYTPSSIFSPSEQALQELELHWSEFYRIDMERIS